MPELPEVETIVRDLRSEIVGRKICGARFLTRSVWRRRNPSARLLTGAHITALGRRGKNILVFLSNDHVLIIHLKMTGRLTLESRETPIKKHTHFIIDFEKGQLRFNDIRRFGYLDLVKKDGFLEVSYLRALGPDALEISRDDFMGLLKSKKRIIKAFIMDQSMIAGMGNIYTDEALFCAGIHPKRVSSTLSRIKAGNLYSAMRDVLEKAIAARGSSVDDYVDGKGERGSFQDQHFVYGREGEPCKRCGRAIKRIIIGSRSTHFCPGCQR